MHCKKCLFWNEDWTAMHQGCAFEHFTFCSQSRNNFNDLCLNFTEFLFMFLGCSSVSKNKDFSYFQF